MDSNSIDSNGKVESMRRFLMVDLKRVSRKGAKKGLDGFLPEFQQTSGAAQGQFRRIGPTRRNHPPGPARAKASGTSRTRERGDCRF